MRGCVATMYSQCKDLNIGVTLSQFPVYPAQFEPTAKDMESVEMAGMFINRFYLDGVFKGKYPEELFSKLWPIVPNV
ncbi:hypothetical protein D3C85_1657020 [compost metagenome]